jgi:4-amino-4-deoxy-L-arabinose transferase-like glycosyltransferase
VSTATGEARPSIDLQRGLSAALDFAVASHWRAIGLLVAFSLLAFLPGFFQIPPIDRDEARFAQATKQMLETNDFVDIRFQTEVRYKKPVGIYWLQAAAVKASETLGVPQARNSIWIYRLPSLAGATFAVLLTYWAALAFAPRRAAVLAALMMASSVLLGVEARLAKTDAMLLLASVAAMGAFARIYLASKREPEVKIGWQQPAILWTAIAAGVLLKGPLILMFVGLTAAVLCAVDRSLQLLWSLRPVPGLLWLLLLACPWFIAIAAKSGGNFFVQSIGHDMLDKVTSGQEAHGAPPGYYLLLFWVTFWPGAVLAVLAASIVWKSRKEPGARFLLAWLLPSWLVFEAVMTKLPHYVLPLYPAIAILIAGIVEPYGVSKQRWMARGTIGWFLFPAAIAIGVLVLFIMFGRELGLAAWPFSAVGVIFGLFAWWLYEADGAERSLLRAMAASIFMAITVYAITIPQLPSLFPSALIAEEIRAADCERPRVASTYGYQEPSLVFLLGTETRFTDGAGAADFLRSKPCHFALIDARSERSFVQSAESMGLRYSLVRRVQAYNINTGKPISLSIFRSQANE